MSRRFVSILLIAFVPALDCCASSGMGASSQSYSLAGQEESGKPKEISRAELQGHVLRFVSEFNEDIRGAFEPLTTARSLRIRRQALLSRLAYNSSALDVALGPTPETNVLDLVAFIELNGDVFREYWVPRFYGRAGEPVLREFERAKTQVWRLASRILTPVQRGELERIIQLWRQDHPGQTAVEAVRLTEFAEETGAHARQLQEETSGLFSEIKKATGSADAAVLLGERALYYAQRAPFLYRLQAQVGVYDLVNAASDALGGQARGEALLPQVNGLARTADAAARDGAALMDSTLKILKLVYEHRNLEFSRLRNQAISGGVQALEEYNRALGSPLHAENLARLDGMPGRIEAAANRVLLKLVLCGAFLIAFAAAMVALSRIAYARWRERHAGLAERGAGPGRKAA